MPQEKVAIVIPHYNAINYIVESVRSALDQAYKEIEIVVVNDSPDLESDLYHTIHNTFDDTKNIHILFNERNSGAAFSRNRGIRAAVEKNCDYVLFHDADDILEPDCITARIDLFKNPEISMVYSDYYNANESGEIISYENKPDFNHGRLVEDNYITCLSMHRTELLNMVGGFNEYLTYGEDHHLALSVARYGLPIRVSKPLFRYRSNPNSLTRDVDWNVFALDRDIVKEYISIWRNDLNFTRLMLAINRKVQYVSGK